MNRSLPAVWMQTSSASLELLSVFSTFFDCFFIGLLLVVDLCEDILQNSMGRYLIFSKKHLLFLSTAKIKRENQIGTETVGLDIGPSTAAIVGDTDALLLEFCPEVELLYTRVKIARRKMDRSLRVTNPSNFNEAGTIKTGKKQWVLSTRYRTLKTELSDLQRVLAETRKRSHGKLVNNNSLSGPTLRPRNCRTKHSRNSMAKAFQDAL